MKNKQLQKLIKRLAELSLKDGKLIETQIAKSIKSLKKLNGANAIWAMSEYLKELKRRERQFTMYIETSIPLSLAQLKSMKKIVEKKHKITKILMSVNPQILGGFKLRIGDQVWDETLLGKIEQMKGLIVS